MPCLLIALSEIATYHPAATYHLAPPWQQRDATSAPDEFEGIELGEKNPETLARAGQRARATNYLRDYPRALKECLSLN